MHSFKVSNVFSRFIGNNNIIPCRNVSMNIPLQFNVTNILLGEPLKKKKRMDPAVIRAREERKRRKIEKSIRRLEKTAQQLKPLIELDIPIKLMDELPLRKRNLAPPSVEKIEERIKLLKSWTKYKCDQNNQITEIINNLIDSQDLALKKLKAESEELYLAAIEIDDDLLPYSAKGPVATAPIENFDSPDGEYINITKKFEGET